MTRQLKCLLGRVNWGMVWVVLFALLTWFAAYASAQASVSDARPGRVIERLYVSDDVREIWDSVVACAGEKRDTTKTLDQIVFLLREPGKLGASGRLIKGEWVPPDTVYITQGYEHSGWIVAHEMLHHALNGPPGNDKHPYVPFAYPCRLWNDPTGSGATTAATMLGGPNFAYPVMGFAVYIQGTLLAGSGWWR